MISREHVPLLYKAAVSRYGADRVSVRDNCVVVYHDVLEITTVKGISYSLSEIYLVYYIINNMLLFRLFSTKLDSKSLIDGRFHPQQRKLAPHGTSNKLNLVNSNVCYGVSSVNDMCEIEYTEELTDDNINDICFHYMNIDSFIRHQGTVPYNSMEAIDHSGSSLGNLSPSGFADILIRSSLGNDLLMFKLVNGVITVDIDEDLATSILQESAEVENKSILTVSLDEVLIGAYDVSVKCYFNKSALISIKSHIEMLANGLINKAYNKVYGKDN